MTGSVGVYSLPWALASVPFWKGFNSGYRDFGETHLEALEFTTFGYQQGWPGSGVTAACPVVPKRVAPHKIFHWTWQPNKYDRLAPTTDPLWNY